MKNSFLETIKDEERLIVSLDVNELDKIERIVEQLGDDVHFYKIGLESFLFTQAQVLDYLKKLGKKVFLDLKFYDIPETVTKASLYPIKQEVEFFTVHCSLGATGLKRVAKLIESENSSSVPLGVTVLTSFGEKEFQETYQTHESIGSSVLHFAKLIINSGLKGIVCSSKEALSIKALNPSFITVCPGIRLSSDAHDDQARVMTPYQAVKNGSDFLVMGRSILNAVNKKETVSIIQQEIQKGLYERKKD
jgi:orotidine-5'-phosphate decarboxylase